MSSALRAENAAGWEAGSLLRLGEVRGPEELAGWLSGALGGRDGMPAGWLIWGDRLLSLGGEGGPARQLPAPVLESLRCPEDAEAPGGELAALLGEPGRLWTRHELAPRPGGKPVLLLLSQPPSAELLALAGLAADRLLLEETGRSLKVREQELEERQNSFLSLINHELRTPLTAILGFADLSLELPASGRDPALMQFLEGIRFSARNLSQRIAELLTMGGISSARLQVERDAQPLVELVREFREQVLPDVPGHERVRLPATAPELTLRVDRQHFLRILVHLVDNALKFSPGERPVELQWGRLEGRRATDPGDFLRVDVRDRGPGIPLEEQARIFEKFYQIEASSTRTRGGMGLGLTLAREFTEAMGGKLWVQSEPGRGSVFSFTIPLLS